MKREKIEKGRLCLYVPKPLYDSLNSDSKKYGISKTAIIQNLLYEHYREQLDNPATCEN